MPEEIYVGTCGVVVSWKRLLKDYSALEINSTFYRFPSEEQVRRWAEHLRERRGFFLALKAFQGLTHPLGSPTWRRAGLAPEERERFAGKVGCLSWNEVTASLWERTLVLARSLGADFVLFQLPASCRGRLDPVAFFREVGSPGPGLGLELRSGEGDLLEAAWRECGVIPVFDPLLEPALRERFLPRLDTLYLRLHGRRSARGRLDYRHRYTDEELCALRDLVLGSRAERVVVVFNNAHMRDDARRFAALLAARGRCQEGGFVV